MLKALVFQLVETASLSSRWFQNWLTTRVCTPYTTALKLHRDTLTEYEQSEVLEYPQIWYTARTTEVQVVDSTNISLTPVC